MITELKLPCFRGVWDKDEPFKEGGKVLLTKGDHFDLVVFPDGLLLNKTRNQLHLVVDPEPLRDHSVYYSDKHFEGSILKGVWDGDPIVIKVHRNFSGTYTEVLKEEENEEWAANSENYVILARGDAFEWGFDGLYNYNQDIMYFIKVNTMERILQCKSLISI